MKTLYLVRHAKSSWKQPELDDFDRPLNSRGKRDAPFIGNILKEQKVNPDVLISSPALRAFTTAQFFAEQMGCTKEDIIKDENIYEASASELLDIIRSIDDKYKSAMLFGHNPGFTTLNNYISDRYIDNIPTCSVGTIQFEVGSWKEINTGTGTLVGFEFPKKYFK